MLSQVRTQTSESRKDAPVFIYEKMERVRIRRWLIILLDHVDKIIIIINYYYF